MDQSSREMSKFYKFVHNKDSSNKSDTRFETNTIAEITNKKNSSVFKVILLSIPKFKLESKNFGFK